MLLSFLSAWEPGQGNIVLKEVTLKDDPTD